MPKISEEAKKSIIKGLSKTEKAKKIKRKMTDLAPGTAKIGVALAKAAMDKKIKGRLRLGKNISIKGEVGSKEKKISINFNKSFK